MVLPRWPVAAALLLLVAAGACDASAQSRKLSAVARPAIVNGTAAPQGRYKYIASLRADNGAGGNYHLCGGTLIHPQVVLTAAHCVRVNNIAVETECTPRDPLLFVRVGLYTRNGVVADEGAEERTVSAVFSNPEWKCSMSAYNQTFNYMNNDVALILLSSPITSIKPISLIGYKPKPQWNNPVRTGTPSKVIGWGSTTDPYPPTCFDPPCPTPADTLQQARSPATLRAAAELPMLMQLLGLQAVCQPEYGVADWGYADDLSTRSYQTFNDNAMICASRGWSASNGGFCMGDSGGPLVVPGPSAATDKQIGIVSFGPPTCNSPNTPYVFTDVGAVYPWIDATIKQLTGKPVTAAVTFNPPRAVGFDSIKHSFSYSPGFVYDILGLSGQWLLTAGFATGLTDGSVVADQWQWQWGGTNVLVDLNLDSREVTLTVNGRAAGPNTYRALSGGGVRYNRILAGQAKTITIVQAPVTVQIVQPWVRLGGAWGWAPWLDVSVTLSALPADLNAFYGLLSGTFPTQTSTVYNTASARAVKASARRATKATAKVAALSARGRSARRG